MAKTRAKKLKLNSGFRCDNIKLDSKTYDFDLETALYKIHYNMSNKEITKEATTYAKTMKEFKKTPFSMLSDYDFRIVGKYLAVINRGGELKPDVLERILGLLGELAEKAQARSIAKKAAEKAEEEAKSKVKVISIQDRLRMRAEQVAGEEFEGLVDELVTDPKKFDIKKFDPVRAMHLNELKQGHLRYLIKMYEPQIAELEEFLQGDCPDLKEGYSYLGKTGAKKLIKFYQAITDGANMIITKSKATRKPRKKAIQPADKVIEKLKYKKDDQTLKVASVNPIDILGAKEVWVYNTKQRKIGVYKAFDETGLYVKGTSITNFSKDNSKQKTLRKPQSQLRDFKGTTAKLNKAFNAIKTVDTKLTGRVNDQIIILRIFK